MQPVIDPSQPLPVYVQLKTLLLEGIIGGRYAAGERLPTEHELCALYGISRTPVHRALAELAEEGAILRHRRRGTFVNPHWLTQHGSGDELRVVVPEGPWEDLVREACPVGTTLSVAPVALEDLHQVLVHAVAEGRAPDVALLDSVWVREFASAGFLLPLDEVDPGWMGEDYLGDLLQPFRAANEYDGRPVAVQAEADVVGLWYHRGTLDDAGIAPPRTWAELARAGAALRARGVEHPLAMPAGSRGGEATSYCLLGLLATNGVEVLREGRVTIDSPGTTECLTLLRRLTTSGTLSVDAVTYERERALRLLAHGQAAFAIGGSYELSHLAAETGVAVTRVWDEFGFVAPPAGPRGGDHAGGGRAAHPRRGRLDVHLRGTLRRPVGLRGRRARRSPALPRRERRADGSRAPVGAVRGGRPALAGDDAVRLLRAQPRLRAGRDGRARVRAHTGGLAAG